MVDMTLAGKSILDRLGVPDFEPLKPFSGGIAQTIVGDLWRQPVSLPQEQLHWVEVAEGEHVLLNEFTLGKNAKHAALLVHGLNGSFESGYIQRMTQLLLKGGFRVFCMNMRNSGKGLGRAKTTYHAGRSDDVVVCLNYLREISDFEKYALIGYSLGANVVLKALGEGNLNEFPLIGASISPPTDLDASSKRLRGVKGKIFDLIFSYRTYQEVLKMQPHLAKDLSLQKWHMGISLRDLDELVTAPMGNFSSALDYYTQSSSARVFHQIKKPTLVLTSDDDPVICPKFLLNAPPVPGVEVVVTKFGGHVGFLDRRTEWRRWMDILVSRFIFEKFGTH